jgi:RNA polymerase sigma-70 factor (ECF subfamily)
VNPAPDAGGLFDRHHLVVYRYLCRMTRRPDVAEDLTQDVFVRALGGLERYEARDLERAWLFRIARNLLLDRQRQEARRSPSSDVDADTLGMTSAHDDAIDLNRALAELDPLDRDVFLQREVGGLGYVEIGRVCDITPDAVRSRIFRARSKLRALLRDPSPVANT